MDPRRRAPGLGHARPIPLHGQAPAACHARPGEFGSERAHDLPNARQRGASGAHRPLRRRGASRPRRRRQFNSHAQRWRYGQKARWPANLSRSITCPSRTTANNSRSSRPSPPSASNSWFGPTTVPPPVTPNASSKPSGPTSRTRRCPPRSTAAANSWPTSSRPAGTSVSHSLRPATPQATLERMRGTSQRQHQRRVLEPPRQRVHRRRRQSRPGRPTALP